MIKSAIDIIKQLLGFANDMEDIKAKSKTMQAQLDETTKTLQAVLFEFIRLKENEAHERENLALRLQLAMKDQEQRALPPGSGMQDTPGLQAQVDALRQEVEALKIQVAELKKQSSPPINFSFYRTGKSLTRRPQALLFAFGGTPPSERRCVSR